MRNNFCLAAGVCVAALLPAAAARAQQPATMKIEAPEITGIQEWLNSKPLKLRTCAARWWCCTSRASGRSKPPRLKERGQMQHQEQGHQESRDEHQRQPRHRRGRYF